jgi:hypothetical protein
MYPHHKESIQNVRAFFESDSEILALLLGGSIAHGFAGAASDVDIMIVVSDQDYRKRLQSGQTQFFTLDLVTYEGGYVDGKYQGISFLGKVAQCGSEPARFAFADAQILFSRIDGLEDLLRRITRYPFEGKTERIKRFSAQLEAWNWYTGEALKRDNPYLLDLAVSKLALFGGRMILAHNELLYPYHKWFLRVLEQAPEKPEGLVAALQTMCETPQAESVRQFYELVRGFRAWEMPDTPWPNQFMIDSELNWMSGMTPVDDL